MEPAGAATAEVAGDISGGGGRAGAGGIHGAEGGAAAGEEGRRGRRRGGAEQACARPEEKQRPGAEQALRDSDPGDISFLSPG